MHDFPNKMNVGVCVNLDALHVNPQFALTVKNKVNKKPNFGEHLNMEVEY